jgi:hypothetical protein
MMMFYHVCIINNIATFAMESTTIVIRKMHYCI